MLKKHGILIEGLVTIRQGDKIIAKDVPNHFVDQGLKGIISTIISTGTAWQKYWLLWYNGWHVYLGSDTATATAHGTTALTTPIGAAPGTAPDAKDASTTDGSGDGIWNVVFSATWNAGTVVGTLGELALYMKAPDQSGFGWSANNYNPAEVMVSRLSSKDADFSSFVIDNTKPLTVEWKVQISFV